MLKQLYGDLPSSNGIEFKDDAAIFNSIKTEIMSTTQREEFFPLQLTKGEWCNDLKLAFKKLNNVKPAADESKICDARAATIKYHQSHALFWLILVLCEDYVRNGRRIPIYLLKQQIYQLFFHNAMIEWNDCNMNDKNSNLFCSKFKEISFDPLDLKFCEKYNDFSHELGKYYQDRMKCIDNGTEPSSTRCKIFVQCLSFMNRLHSFTMRKKQIKKEILSQWKHISHFVLIRYCIMIAIVYKIALPDSIVSAIDENSQDSKDNQDTIDIDNKNTSDINIKPAWSELKKIVTKYKQLSPQHDTADVYDSLAVECSDIVLNNVPLVQVPGTWMRDVDINLTDDIIVANSYNYNYQPSPIFVAGKKKDEWEELRLKIYLFSRYLNHQIEQIYVQSPDNMYNLKYKMKPNDEEEILKVSKCVLHPMRLLLSDINASDISSNILTADIVVMISKKRRQLKNLNIHFLYKTKIGWIRHSESMMINEVVYYRNKNRKDGLLFCTHKLSSTELFLSSLTNIWKCEWQTADPASLDRTEKASAKQLLAEMDNKLFEMMDDDKKSPDDKKKVEKVKTAFNDIIFSNIGLWVKYFAGQKQFNRAKIVICATLSNKVVQYDTQIDNINNDIELRKSTPYILMLLSLINIGERFFTPSDCFRALKTIMLKLENANLKRNSRRVTVLEKSLRKGFKSIMVKYMKNPNPIVSFTIPDLMRLIPCVNIIYSLYHRYRDKGLYKRELQIFDHFCQQLKQITIDDNNILDDEWIIRKYNDEILSILDVNSIIESRFDSIFITNVHLPHFLSDKLYPLMENRVFEWLAQSKYADNSIGITTVIDNHINSKNCSQEMLSHLRRKLFIKHTQMAKETHTSINKIIKIPGFGTEGEEEDVKHGLLFVLIASNCKTKTEKLWLKELLNDKHDSNKKLCINSENIDESFLSPLEFAIKQGYYNSAGALLENENVQITAKAVVDAWQARSHNTKWQSMWKVLVSQLCNMTQCKSVTRRYLDIEIFRLVKYPLTIRLQCLTVFTMIEELNGLINHYKNEKGNSVLMEAILLEPMNRSSKVLSSLLKCKFIHVPYETVVAASVKHRREIFVSIVDKYACSYSGCNKTSIDVNTATDVRNINGRTAVGEALQRGFYNSFHTLCKYTNAPVTFDDVLRAIVINDQVFASAMAGYMRYNKILDLKMFKSMIDWDKLKKLAIGTSWLLRDICENGIKKKSWIYIAIRLDYNLYEAISNIKKIPHKLFEFDAKNTDKANINLERKHYLKKSKKINNWYVGKILGKGTFGQVKMGIDKEGKRVALKFIDIPNTCTTDENLANSKDKQMRNRLISFIAGEISNIQSIDHENVIRLLAFNLNANNKIMLVFEYAEYGDLYQVIGNGKSKRLSVSVAKYIFLQILSGLQTCHALDIIHRDIKPQNILVTRDYSNDTITTKIADFGLSDVTQSLADSKQLIFVGTRGYMSPEIASPPTEYYSESDDDQSDLTVGVTTGACDVFSAGVILWQMIYGINLMPFDEARENDSKYYYIATNNSKLFWKCHPKVEKLNNKGRTELEKRWTENVKHLFLRLFEYHPHKRITIDSIHRHNFNTLVKNLSGRQFTLKMTQYVGKGINQKNKDKNHLFAPSCYQTSTWLSHAKMVCQLSPYTYILIQCSITFFDFININMDKILIEFIGANKLHQQHFANVCQDCTQIMHCIELDSLVCFLRHVIHSPSAYSPVAAYTSSNPLIAMIGISNYDETHLPSLEGVYNDYWNVKQAFNFSRGYSMVYFNQRNQLIYINDKIDAKEDIDDKFKLKWTSDDIDMFNEQIHENILNNNNNTNTKYNHDSLIYFISCHGNRDEIIYDSDGEEYSLAFIYDQFTNLNCQSLRNKPKIFIVDADRVDVSIKTHRASLTQSVSRTPRRESKTLIAKTSKTRQVELEEKTDLPVQSLINKKTFTKDEHFRKIFCNSKDSKFVDVGKIGSYLVESITTVFANDKYFYNQSLSDILRETRSIIASSMGIKPNQPSMVAIHERNSLPYKVKFSSNYQSMLTSVASSSIHGRTNHPKLRICPMTCISKPFIAFLGISEYEKDVNSSLYCVPTDFENIVKSLNYKRGYDIGYYSNDGKLKVIEGRVKSISRHVKQLKLKWDESDIFSFNEMVYEHISKNCNHYKKNATNGYDGLMYFISCHGESGGVIIDSKGEEIPLITIFDTFNNLNCKSLCNKPKIFWISACRGNMITKRFVNPDYNYQSITNIGDNKHNSIKDDSDYKSDTTLQTENGSHVRSNDMIEEKTQENNQEKKADDEAHDDDDNCNSKSKGVVNNLRLFSKFNWNRIIYGNTDGYGVVEPGNKGEYMIRSITKAFENDDILNMDFDQIMVQIRQILVKIMGQTDQCAAQVIDDHNDIPAKLFFKTKSVN